MRGYVWSTLNEEERYEVWSLHLEHGGADINYPEFCDLMDGIHA